jgi:7-cyano-7-deazaguanine reductase
MTAKTALMSSNQQLKSDLPLGKSVGYFSSYYPEILFRIPRNKTNSNLFGFDRWVCYELTHLLQNGFPFSAGLEIIVPADSNFIVESKSLKLYLGSLASEKFESPQIALETIKSDLGKLLETENLQLRLLSTSNPADWEISELSGKSIDSESVDCSEFDQVNPELLQKEEGKVQERLKSHLFRSLCPVTQQPDYASVLVEYSGDKIQAASLLRYLASYRNHAGFHESCCEEIFSDLLERFQPEKLIVACYFSRRGGIEINPLRSNHIVASTDFAQRVLRQ